MSDIKINVDDDLVGENFIAKNGREYIRIMVPDPGYQGRRTHGEFVVTPERMVRSEDGCINVNIPEDGVTQITVRRPGDSYSEQGGQKIGFPNPVLKTIIESYGRKRVDGYIMDYAF